MRQQLRYLWLRHSHRRNLLPACADGMLSRLHHLIARRPRVCAAPAPRWSGGIEIAPFAYDRPAAFCVSTTFELAWGWRYARTSGNRREFPVLARENFAHLLALSEQYDIPISWAVLGHLFLDHCQRDASGRAHPDMPRPTGFYHEHPFWDWSAGDWYQHDPCTGVGEDPLWYAPDLIGRIVDSRVAHEIGTHSFSHVDFAHPTCPPDLVRGELEKCIACMRPYGLRPRSIVFPGGLIDGHLDILAEQGIIAYQGALDTIAYPQRSRQGLWNVCGSLFLGRGRGYDFCKRFQRNLAKAVRRRLAFNFVMSDPFFYPRRDSEAIKVIFERILRHVQQQRAAEALWVTTLSDIARYCEARLTTELEAQRDAGRIAVGMHSRLDHNRFGPAVVTLRIGLPEGRDADRVVVDEVPYTPGADECYRHPRDGHLILTLPVTARRAIINLT